MADGYWSELWADWFRPLSQDFLKTLGILAALYALWELLALMRWSGYPPVYIEPLEKTHFVFMWASLVTTSANFLGKQLVGLWKKPNKS
jgi:hypothetical protein